MVVKVLEMVEVLAVQAVNIEILAGSFLKRNYYFAIDPFLRTNFDYDYGFKQSTSNECNYCTCSNLFQ